MAARLHNIRLKKRDIIIGEEVIHQRQHFISPKHYQAWSIVFMQAAPIASSSSPLLQALGLYNTKGVNEILNKLASQGSPGRDVAIPARVVVISTHG